VVSDTWKALRKAIQGRSSRGLHEVLELKDWGGKEATFKKRERVRYLQDSAIAHQDRA
jgi:hypothetical protein